MFANCKKVFLTLLLFLPVGATSLSAAALRWVHLGTIDAGLVNLAVDGKITFRKMSPGKATSWTGISAGLHRFQIGSEADPGSSFELEITPEQKIVIVSVSDKDGNLHSRSVSLDAYQNEAFVLNMMPGTIMTGQESGQKAIFGKGLRIPLAKEPGALSFADAEGLKGEVDFSRTEDAPQDPYLAILSHDDDGKPYLSLLRDRDSLFEISGESIEIPDELAAAVRILSQRSTADAGTFNPASVDWEEVDSRIFWLNLAMDRDPSRLEIRGFPAMRRMPPGRGSGFVKWPAGEWDADVVAESSHAKLGSGKFSLPRNSAIGLISAGGGKYPHRLFTLEGRSGGKSGEAAKPQIRFANAMPDGVLKSTIRCEPKPVSFAIKPGEAGDVVPLVNSGFPGAALDLDLGTETMQGIAEIPAMPSLPPGDWVIVVHLDQESFATPVITWVEMDKGSITGPPGREADP